MMLVISLAVTGVVVANPAAAASKVPANGTKPGTVSSPKPTETQGPRAVALQRCFSHAWMDAESTPGTATAGGAGRCVGHGVFNYLIIETTVKRNGSVIWRRFARYNMPRKGVRYQAPMFEGPHRWGRFTATVIVLGRFTYNMQCIMASSETTASDITWQPAA